jgi:hypothetical protein
MEFLPLCEADEFVEEISAAGVENMREFSQVGFQEFLDRRILLQFLDRLPSKRKVRLLLYRWRMESMVVVGKPFAENALPERPPTPLLRRFARQFQSPLIYILLFALVADAAIWVSEGATGLPVESIAIAVILLLSVWPKRSNWRARWVIFPSVWLSTGLKERVSPPASSCRRKLKRPLAKLSGRRSPQSSMWTRETEFSHNDLTAI